MKLNLKIVAAAVAMMCSGATYAQSVSIPGGPFTYSKEGLTLTDTGAVSLPVLTVTFGNNLTNNDDILIFLPGGVLSLPSNAAAVVCAGTTVGYVGTVNGGWNFRVADPAGASLGDTCTFTGLPVQGKSLASSNGTVYYQANRTGGGQTVDQANNSTGIVVKSQFALTAVTKLDGEIDVYADRLLFSAAETVPPGDVGAPLQNDTLAFNTDVLAGLPNLAAFTGPTVTPTKTTVTISGDFDWVDDSGTATLCAAPGDFAGNLNAFGWTVDATSNCAKLVLTNASASNIATAGNFVVDGNDILDPTDYTATVVWDYFLTGTPAKIGTSPATNWDPGAWTINGAQVYIQYMPYGTGVSRIIYAANSGAINADGTVDVFYNGNVDQCDLGSVSSRTVTQLSAVIDACVAGLGITSGKVALLLTFTAPDTDIEVYSAYNVGGSDRGTVVNTSNGRGLTYFSKVD